jgi:hypothetical protein
MASTNFVTAGQQDESETFVSSALQCRLMRSRARRMSAVPRGVSLLPVGPRSIPPIYFG